MVSTTRDRFAAFDAWVVVKKCGAFHERRCDSVAFAFVISIERPRVASFGLDASSSRWSSRSTRSRQLSGQAADQARGNVFP
jgi:hypothetical protein